MTTENYDKETLESIRHWLIENDWENLCASSFAKFITMTNENNVNCPPDKYPYWCEFIIAAYKLKDNRPSTIMLKNALAERMGWNMDGDSIKFILSEYDKGLFLLKKYDEKMHK